MPLPALDLWQYRLTPTNSPSALPIGDLWLELGEGLPMTHITDAKGLSVGMLLGHPIDLNARSMIRETWQAPATLDASADTFAQSVLNALGGRFLWIFHTDDIARIYPDSVSQIPCVVDPDARLVGSTAHALFDEDTYVARFNKALFDKLGVNGEGWFPAGLTAHHGVHRLLPNHYLDLTSLDIKRCWHGIPVETGNPDAVLDEIIDLIQAQVEALSKEPQKIAMALTAGLDSRTVLACSRNYMDKIACFTVTGGDRHEVDTVIAKRISKSLGFEHITLPRVMATPEQETLFIRRGGHCNGDSNARYHPTVWPLADDNYVFIGGVGGEVARPPYIRAADTVDTDLPIQTLINRLGLPSTEALKTTLETYVADMGDVDSLRVIDFLFQEARYAAWYGVQFCSDPTLIRHAPLMTTRTVDLMCSLPPEWKKSQRFGREVIRRCWPELDTFPYNSLGFWRDKYVDLKRVIDDPRLVIKKLRKKLG